jgi:hypothetical protein
VPRTIARIRPVGDELGDGVAPALGAAARATSSRIRGRLPPESASLVGPFDHSAEIGAAAHRHVSGLLAPRGIEEVLRLDIFSDARRIHSISLGRPWASGPFTTDELAFAVYARPAGLRDLPLQALRARRAEALD